MSAHIHTYPVDASLTSEQAWHELCVMGFRATDTGSETWAVIECDGDECRSIHDRRLERRFYAMPRAHDTSYLEGAAELLAEGWDPDDIKMRHVLQRAINRMVRQQAKFHLIAINKDRPDAARYGTRPDGTPLHAPEWYAVQGVVTGIHEALNCLLIDLFRCPRSDACGLDIDHDGACWDSQVGEWIDGK